MDSYFQREVHESGAKRIKLDTGELNNGARCDAIGFVNFSTTAESQIESAEGINTDCDSGYEASMMGSVSTPSHLTSPSMDQINENSTSYPECLQTQQADLDILDTSQDSIEADDDNVSTITNLSELSGISELSGQNWKPMAGSMMWIQKQMASGIDPRTLLMELGVDLQQLPQGVDDFILWKLIINMLAEPPRRHKLRHVNTVDDVVELLRVSKNVIILTGAGVSVSCGIPDFRSKDGIYSRLAVDFPNLPDPQAMFDINFFNNDPRPFFKFAKDIYPGKFNPSPCHQFIKVLEKHGKLLRNYTQNIDTLEKVTGIEKVIECHGSFATATCTKCQNQVTAEEIREIVLSQNIPVCRICQPDIGSSIAIDGFKDKDIEDLRKLVSDGIMKPDIVFFGEGLPDTFHEAMADDKNKCDLLLVIGSSLKVRPVALIPSSLSANVPQILINREPLPHCHFDVELLGDCDGIINHICQLLGSTWDEAVYNKEPFKETLQLLPLKEQNTLTSNTLQIATSMSSSFTEVRQSQKTECNCTSSKVETSVTVTSACTCITKSITPSGIFEGDITSVKSIKERHISTDSAKDSGIGENSNFTDNEEQRDAQTASERETNPPKKSNASKGCWQPKQKRSISERLPKNSFYLIPPSRYIFPGAEVYYNPNEKYNYFDNSFSSDSSGSESEVENVDISF